MNLWASKVVVDTNTVVRAFGDWKSPSGIIVNGCLARRPLLLLSDVVLKEYRRVLRYSKIVRDRAAFSKEIIEEVLDKLRYDSEYPDLRSARFKYERDPTDEKFIELAIAGAAKYIVTRDLDLLSLGTDHSEVAQRFRRRLPATRIVRPEQFLAESAI